MKIAFDLNIPPGMARIFQALASERQFTRLVGGFQIESARKYTPKAMDADHIRGSDVPWIKRFAAEGGRIIISGDTSMRIVPHERLALLEAGMIVVFFERRWARLQFFSKCALLMRWWPVVAKQVKKAKPATFWAIPTKWEVEKKLRTVSSADLKLLKIERQKADGPAKRAIRQQRKEAPSSAQMSIRFPTEPERKDEASHPAQGDPKTDNDQ